MSNILKLENTINPLLNNDLQIKKDVYQKEQTLSSKDNNDEDNINKNENENSSKINNNNLMVKEFDNVSLPNMQNYNENQVLLTTVNEIKNPTLKTEENNLNEVKELNNEKEENNEINITKEKYLQDKLNNLDIADSIKNAVNLGINTSNRSIYKDIMNNNLEINNSQTNLNQILSKVNISTNDINKISKNLPQDLQFQLKGLLKNEEQIKKNLNKIENSKKALESEDIKGIKNTIVENNIRNAQLKDLNEKKDLLSDKLETINYQIENILNYDRPSKKEKIKNFLENFEKDKETINEKISQLNDQSFRIQEKMKNDLTNYYKKQKEFEQKEKEEYEKHKKLLKEQREKEREIIAKRKKEIDEKVKKTKAFINAKNQQSEKDYIYFKYKEKFELEEKKLLDKINLQHKESLVSKEEINELNEKYKEQQKLIEQEKIEKTKQLHEMWNNRSQILPKNKSSFLIKYEEELNKKIEEEEEYKIRKKNLEKIKEDYAENKIPKPVINPNLRIEAQSRKDKIDKESVKATQLNNKKRLDNFVAIQPKISRKKSKSPTMTRVRSSPKINDNNDNNTLENNVINNKINEKKSGKKYLKPIYILHPKPEKPIDYLKEKRKKCLSPSPTNNHKKYINVNLNKKVSDNQDLIEDIQQAKIQTELLDNQVKQKNQLIKYSGGYEKNPELGDEVGNMIIESIQAKLQMIQKLSSK